jgi:diguanylate cyclase (GGDEF)-like protein
MYALMTIIPVMFLLYIIFRWLFSGVGTLSGSGSSLGMTLILGIGAIVLMSLAGMALIYRSLRSIETLSRRTGSYLQSVGKSEPAGQTGNEAEKLSNYFTVMLSELEAKVKQAGQYAQELAEANRKLANLSVKDSLTGLYNHGYIKERLKQEVIRARNFNRRLSLIMIDLDDFKIVNDTHGHLAGDGVIRRVGQLISQSVGGLGIAARYGGEEFLLLLPEAGADKARKAALDICSGVEQYGFLLTPETDSVPGRIMVRLTVSIGVCSFPADGDAEGRLIAAADSALYQAKNSGKNQVVVYKLPEKPALNK